MHDSRQNHLETALPRITSPNSIELSDDEQEHLFALIHKGVNSARMITRARILAKLAKGHSGRAPAFKKANLLPWQKQQWCIVKVDEEFVACMEDVIELYALPLDEKSTVVCFDESPF